MDSLNFKSCFPLTLAVAWCCLMGVFMTNKNVTGDSQRGDSIYAAACRFKISRIRYSVYIELIHIILV